MLPSGRTSRIVANRYMSSVRHKEDSGPGSREEGKAWCIVALIFSKSLEGSFPSLWFTCVGSAPPSLASYAASSIIHTSARPDTLSHRPRPSAEPLALAYAASVVLFRCILSPSCTPQREWQCDGAWLHGASTSTGALSFPLVPACSLGLSLHAKAIWPSLPYVCGAVLPERRPWI